jgi:CHAD domain-containing protein
VFPAEELSLLAAMAAQLAALTSPVRDLDVLLVDLDDRTAVVATRLWVGRADLRTQLVALRARSRAELLEALEGEFSSVLLRRWQTMASVYRVGGTEAGPDARRPAGEVVDEVIWGSFRRLRKQGRRARASEVDADWHRLRKRLKRFRYLLMAFEDMYPPRTFSKVLRELAELQEGLGELQDHVARADLIEGAGLAAGGHGALVAGALVDHLSAETPGARRACEHAWDRFDRPKVRRHLREALSRD